MELMEELSHRNIVNIYSTFFSNNDMELFVIMELCHCDLKKLVEDRNGSKFPIETVLNYCCQIGCGVKYLHSKNTTHQDINPKVIFFIENQ